ncbi:hypothetical protein H0H93_016893 [Arthromyces matolae]|nr:hypothetical protein H0H93_016893 [Arthromyces matolae]
MSPLLPVEITHHIIDLATQLHPGHAHVFSVVSKDLQIRVERIMYKDLVIIDQPSKLPHRIPETAQYERILVALDNRPAEFSATRIHNVLLVNDVSRGRAAVILAKCTGLRNLSYWSYHPSPDESWSLSCMSTLRYLSLSADAFCGLAINKTVFPELTKVHLDAFKFYPSDTMPTLEWLPALRTLTIHDPDEFHWEKIISMVSTAPTLRLIIWEVWKATTDTVEMKEWADKNISHVKLEIREFEGSGTGFNAFEKWRQVSRLDAN